MNKVENIISVINYIEEHLSEKLTLSSIQNTICTGYSPIPWDSPSTIMSSAGN